MGGGEGRERVAGYACGPGNWIRVYGAPPNRHHQFLADTILITPRTIRVCPRAHSVLRCGYRDAPRAWAASRAANVSTRSHTASAWASAGAAA